MAMRGRDVAAVAVVAVLALASGKASAKSKKKKKKKKPGGNYRLAVVGGPSCLTCEFYYPTPDPAEGESPGGRCAVWELPVEPNYVCDKWEQYQDDADDPPPVGCGEYPWWGEEVDDYTTDVIQSGDFALEVEPIAMEVAYWVYDVTPEGEPAVWPPEAGDSSGACIWDKILIRVNLILAELADDEINGDGGFDLDSGEDDEDEPEWPPYPEPGPVDIAQWENPDNYPTPGGFHQVYYDGGDKSKYAEGHPGYNSVQTMKHLAQKALYSFAYTVTQDLDAAKAAGDNPDMWRAYREIIDCSPYNQALTGARFNPPHKYDTPTGLQTALVPAHDSIRAALAEGRTPERFVDEDNPKMIVGKWQPYVWLPPLDPVAFLQGVIQVDPEYWESGDSKLMPPPEVMALGVDGVAPERMWGCDYRRKFGEELGLAP